MAVVVVQMLPLFGWVLACAHEHAHDVFAVNVLVHLRFLLPTCLMFGHCNSCKARKEKQSQDSDTAAKLEDQETELTASWTEKLQRAVAAADTRWDNKYKSLEEDYNDLEARHATATQGVEINCV